MKMTISNAFLFLVVIVAVVVLVPLAVIWSMNTLFPSLNIPYNFETWVAVILLSGAIRTNVTKKD